MAIINNPTIPSQTCDLLRPTIVDAVYTTWAGVPDTDVSTPGPYDNSDGTVLDTVLDDFDDAIGKGDETTQSLAERIDLRLQQILFHMEIITGTEAPDFESQTGTVEAIIFYLEQITGVELTDG